MENIRGFKVHDASSDHLFSITRWESSNIQKNNAAAGIKNMLDPDRLSLVKNNREYMNMLLEYHQYFCAQEMVYKAHDETDESLNAGERKEFVN